MKKELSKTVDNINKKVMFSDQDDSEDLSQNSPGKYAKTDSAPNTDRVPGLALKERSITLAPQKNKKQDLLQVKNKKDEEDSGSDISYQSYGSAVDFKTLSKKINGEKNYRR